MRINCNGDILPPDKAAVPVLDHGFLFGDSIYEVVRTVGANRDGGGRAVLFTVHEHIERLAKSAERIELTLPFTEQEIAAELMRTHDARLTATAENPDEAGSADSYLRLVVTRGSGPITLDPTEAGPPAWFIIATPLPDWGGTEAYSKGVQVAVVERLRTSRQALDPCIKSGNYLNNVLALAEARKIGAREGIMCNAQGFVTEGTTSNIFHVTDGMLATPSLDSGILEGITRGLVIRFARDLGFEVEEGHLRRGDFVSADEAFICSTTRGVMPVTTIDETPIGSGTPGPVTQRLMQVYQQALDEAASSAPSE